MKTQVFENKNIVINTELYNNELNIQNQNYSTVAKNLALTVRKEHRLTVVKKLTKTTIRISWKTLLYVAFLTLANIVI